MEVLDNIEKGVENPTGKDKPKNEKKKLTKKRPVLQQEKKLIEENAPNLITYYLDVGNLRGVQLCHAGDIDCIRGK